MAINSKRLSPENKLPPRDKGEVTKRKSQSTTMSYSYPHGHACHQTSSYSGGEGSRKRYPPNDGLISETCQRCGRAFHLPGAWIVVLREPLNCSRCDSASRGLVETNVYEPYCQFCGEFSRKEGLCRRCKGIKILKMKTIWVMCGTCDGGRKQFYNDIRDECPGSGNRTHNEQEPWPQ